MGHTGPLLFFIGLGHAVIPVMLMALSEGLATNDEGEALFYARSGGTLLESLLDL